MDFYLFCGDVHGDFESLTLTVDEKLKESSVDPQHLKAIFLAGDVEPLRSEVDLNAVHGPAKYRKMGDFGKILSGELKLAAQVYFIGGNHEPWESLDKEKGKWAQGFSFLGRSGQKRIEGLEVAYLSGISSPEMRTRKNQRTENRTRDNRKNRTYWTWEEVQNVKAAGLKKRPDVVLTHEWPTGLNQENGEDSVGSWQIREIIETSQPQFSFHGHMHRRQEGILGETNVIGLDHIRGGLEATCIIVKENGILKKI